MRILAAFFLLTAFAAHAQEKILLYPAAEKVVIDGYEKDKEQPFLDRYNANPDSVNGTTILVCPGGGYSHLALKHEGSDVAQYYTAHGFEVFVLHYRLNSPDQSGHRFPDQYRDVTTALRLIKSRAKTWKLDPERIGILGFSAGGHLASMATTMHLNANKKSKNALEQVSSRPAFSILLYPVIALSGAPAHRGSAEMLLGKNPDNALVDSLSTYNRVNRHTPPTFIVYANDDNGVPPENGILFYQALRQHHIPTSLLIYDHGGHGFGMAPKDPVLNTWPWMSIKWLERLGYK